MYWDLELHWSRHFLLTPTGGLETVAAIKTDCGDGLARGGAPFTRWLLTRCPSCRGEVDPNDGSLRYQNPWTGRTRDVAGLGLHRFALVIDCGKCVPEDTGRGPVLVNPDLVQLVERHLGCTFQDDLGGFC
jgi:hypothetical protein